MRVKAKFRIVYLALGLVYFILDQYVFHFGKTVTGIVLFGFIAFSIAKEYYVEKDQDRKNT